MDLIANFRKGLASVVSTAVVAMTIVAAPSAQAAWYDVYVNALTDAGVVSSDFNPSADTTRLGFTTALVKAAGLSASDNDAGFADVNDGYVNAAVENGIVDGPKAEKGNKFFPSNNINRAEVTKVVLEALGVDVDAYASPSAPHADVPADQWFAPYVSAAYNLSVVDGVNNSTESFDPAGNIKDAAMSKIISYGVIASADPENHVRFDDGVSAFSVYEESDIETNVVALVKVDMGSETETGGETETETGGETVVVSDGSLEVSVSPTSPSSQNIPFNVQAVPYLSVDLTANGDDVNVTSITVNRTGLGNNDDFDKVWFEVEGQRVSSKKTVNSDDVAIVTLQGVTVEAGETVTATLLASMSAWSDNGAGANANNGQRDSDETVQSGHANAFTISSADAVITNAESVVGDFPVTGNTMGIADYEVTTAEFDDSVGSTQTVEVGDTAVEVGKFQLKADGDKDLELKSIRFKNTGNAELAEVLENLFLEKSGQNVAEGTISGDYVTFMFDGYVIESNDTETFRVKADIISQETGNNTIKFKVDDKEDIVAVETDTQYAASAKDPNGADAEDADATLALITLNAGNATVSKDPSSPTNGTYSRSTKGVEALVAKVYADQEISADGIDIVLVTSSGVAADKFENIKLYLNGTLVDSKDGTDTGNGNDETISFDSSVTLKQGTNLIRVEFDVKDEAITSGETVKFTLTGSSAFDSAEYTSNGDSASITGSATSATFTIKQTSYTVTRNDGLKQDSAKGAAALTDYTSVEDIVAGVNDVELLKFVVNATDGEVRINSVTIAPQNLDNGNGTDYDVSTSEITGLELFMNGEQIGDTKDLSSSVQFSGLNVTIPDNSQATIVLKGDVSTAAGDTVLGLTATIEAEDRNADAISDKSVTSGTFAINASGTLAASVDGDTPETQILVANTSDVELAKFKLSADKDDVSITDIYVSNLNGSSSDARVATYKLYNGSTLLDSRVPSNGQARFQIASNSLVVEKDDNVVVTVKADFNSITDETQTNGQFQLALTEVEAESVSTGVDLTSTAMAFQFAPSTKVNSVAVATTTETTVSVADGDGATFSAGDVIQIDSEEMLVASVDSTGNPDVLTVTRGINGTTAATHLVSQAINKIASKQADNMYLRKTRPTLTTQTLSTTKLVSGEQTLYKVSVAADSAEDVEVATLTFNLAGRIGGSSSTLDEIVSDLTDGTDLNDSTCTVGAANGTADVCMITDSDVSVAGNSSENRISGYKLYVNGSQISSSEYVATVTDNGSDFDIKFALSSGNEETVSAGSSKVFELKATVTGATSDDYVSVKVQEDASATNGTVNADAVADITANFIWSDNAASNLSAIKNDWFNGYEVNGLDTATTTLQN